MYTIKKNHSCIVIFKYILHHQVLITDEVLHEQQGVEDQNLKPCSESSFQLEEHVLERDKKKIILEMLLKANIQIIFLITKFFNETD